MFVKSRKEVKDKIEEKEKAEAEERRQGKCKLQPRMTAASGSLATSLSLGHLQACQRL